MNKILVTPLIFVVIFIDTGILSGLSTLFPAASSFFLIPNYVLVVFTICLRMERVVVSIARLPLIVGFVALAFISAYWSIDRSETLTEASRLVLHCLTAISIVCWLGSERAMHLLGQALALGCLLSIAAIAMPQVSLGDTGDFRGLYQQKNELGFAGGLAAIIGLHALLFTKRKMIDGITIVLGLLGIALSQSATSLVVFICCAIFMTLVWSSSRSGRYVRRGPLLFSLALILLSGILAEVFTDDILALLGRDASFTGRAELWEMGRILIAKHAQYGYGYQVLSNEDGYLSRFMIKTVGSYALQFHNSWINIQFQLGYMGLAFNFLCFCWFFYLTFREKEGNFYLPNAILLSAIGIAFCLQSVTESTFGGPRSLQTFIMVIMFLRVHFNSSVSNGGKFQSPSSKVVE